MKRVPLILAALLAARTAGAGGLGGVEGTLVGPGNGLLKGAKVQLSIRCGAILRAIAVDAGGRFRIGDLPEGACTLTASGPGFATQRLAVTVSAGSIATLLVTMAPPMPDPSATPSPVAVDMAGVPAGVEGGVAGAPPPPPAARPRLAHPAPPRAEAMRELRGGGGGRDKLAARPVAIPAQPVAIRADQPARGDRIRARDLRAADELGVLEQQQLIAGEGLAAWAPVRVFPVPQYAAAYDGPRNDFRETIYWNPSVETGDDGTAEVAFVTSDAVTAFRATAEGFSAAGAPGAGQLAFKSKLPLSLDAHLPVEVTAGDAIQLPITLTNETAAAIDATLGINVGRAFRMTANPAAGTIKLGPGEKRALMLPLEVTGGAGSDGAISLVLASRGLEDKLDKTIRVVPRGFPFERSLAGTARRDRPAQHELDLTGALPGTIQATVTMFPSPLASMTQGLEGMIREPGGCFEQTSSTNYPNVMILGYLNANEAADPQLIDKTRGVLDRGYKLLAGFETTQKGYEWFGRTPGHEALTAYGLMEFADMAKVHDVDRAMIERTASWLMSKRDGKGGFTRSATALDSFGRAGEVTTNAYIMWALAEAGRVKGLDAELAAQRALGRDTKDPYLLALAANTNLIAAPAAEETRAMVARLGAMQGKDGSFAGAKESITMSGGESLAIEATSLAVLALLKASPGGEHEPKIRAAVEWLNGKRGGYGQWGNTQATVLGLKALTAYAEHSKQMPDGGTATLIINGKPAGELAFDKGRREALVWDDVAPLLVAGRNTIELRLASGATLPYTIGVAYRAARPQSSPDAKIAVTAKLASAKVRMGEGVKLRAHVENKTGAGVPMTLARIGIPGGAVFQTWQLKELREKGAIDFYETRPREVILYWRALPPSAVKDVDLDLLAAVPGTYEAPASSAYLYYTAEDKAWTPPVALQVMAP